MGDSESGTRRFSLAGRLAGIVVISILVFAGLTLAGQRLLLPVWLTYLIAFGLTLPLATWGAHRAVRPLADTVDALTDGIRSFQDRDFGVRIAVSREDELGELLRLYNRVGELLQDERGQLRQRELLLQTALDQSPVAIILVNPLDRIIYANHEARQAFLGGGRLVGMRFEEVLAACPAEMRQALDAEGSGVFTLDGDDTPETYHLAQRSFLLNRRQHRLYLLRRMTAELARQEAEIWKKIIRIISHELNNSLAPISSLAHSGLVIARESRQGDRMEPIYTSIRERVDYLTRFLEGYARYARLPKPVKQPVDWDEFFAGSRELYSFRIDGELPKTTGHFDPSQVQQVLINLLKNSVEASDETPDIAVRVDPLPDGGARVQVLDRGRGMDEHVMRNALLPFYTTKQAGTGVGLPLCREIIEAHGGSLRIQNRERGGTRVSFWLPAG